MPICMTACAPVLFLVFNRPEQTRRVFEAIRAARPPRLYVAADGPRPDRPGEAERCEQARRIATAVDWPCQLQTLLRDCNLGCGRAVSEAISWFFASEAEGIILEDDCLPAGSFFRLATELLERYREDQRIGQVCGFNLLPEASPDGVDYFTSHFGWNWGWASWQRAWKFFDPEMSGWPRLKQRGLHLQYPFYAERVRLFDSTFRHGCQDIWDYQWHHALASQGQLSMIPSVSLVQNIGFTSDATHTQTADTRRSQPASSLDDDVALRHPEFLLASPDYERQLIRAAHSGAWREHIVARLRRWIPAGMRPSR